MGGVWKFVQSPTVKEDASDTGTALYVHTLHLFGVRLVLALVLMALAFNHYDGRHYLFCNIPDIFYLFQSVTFFLLAISSLLVSFDFPAKMSGPFIEWMYFATVALSVSITAVNSSYYPSIIIMFAHCSLAPKIRARPWFVALLVLCYTPHALYAIFFSSFANHASVLDYYFKIVGLATAGVTVLGLSEMIKYAEFSQRKQVEMEPRPASYSAI